MAWLFGSSDISELCGKIQNNTKELNKNNSIQSLLDYDFMDSEQKSKLNTAL